MWHHIDGVQEATVVKHPRVHVVGHRVILVPTERQGHGGAGTLRGRPSRRGRARRKRTINKERQRRFNKGSQSISPCLEKPTPGAIQQMEERRFRGAAGGEEGGAGGEKGAEKVTVRCGRSSLPSPAAYAALRTMLVRKGCISSPSSPLSSLKSQAAPARGSAGTRSVTLTHTQAGTHAGAGAAVTFCREPAIPVSSPRRLLCIDLDKGKGREGSAACAERWRTAQLGCRMARPRQTGTG